MGKILKFLRHNVYLIGGLLYLAGVLIGFGLALSFAARAINFSLPGGSQVRVPQTTFNIEGYKKIEHLTGIALPEEKTSELQEEKSVEQLIEPSGEAPPATAATTTENEISEVDEEQGTSTASEAEKPVLDKSALSISVLNGSGKAGAAASLRAILEAAGFKVSKVGNTEKTLQSRLEIKDSKNDYAALVVEVIADKYIVDKIVSLAETEAVDAVFIIGLE